MAQEGEEDDDFYRDPDASDGASTGDDDGADASIETEAESDDRLPFRGTSFLYENAMSAGNANDLSSEASFYYGMSYALRPRYYFTDWFSVRGSLSLTHELTDGSTTQMREPLLSDLGLSFVFSDLLGSVTDVINLNASLSLTFPTSKMSQARTMIMAGAIGLSASYTAPVLQGLRLSYSISVSRYFHEYTTSVQESPTIPCTPGSAMACDSQLTTGARNAAWGLRNSLSLVFVPIENLSFGVSVSFRDSFLYGLADVDTSDLDGDVYGTDPNGVEIPESELNTNRQSSIWYVIEVGYQVTPWIGLALGASTLNAQLTPDSEYRAPFFNRFTQVYFDVNLSIDGIVNAIRGRRGGSISGPLPDEV